MAYAITDFVIEIMTQKYVIPPPFNLQDCFEDSSSTSPLIFVLSAGSDPMVNQKATQEQCSCNYQLCHYILVCNYR